VALECAIRQGSTDPYVAHLQTTLQPGEAPKEFEPPVDLEHAGRPSRAEQPTAAHPQEV
jgi:hypothetical protein